MITRKQGFRIRYQKIQNICIICIVTNTTNNNNLSYLFNCSEVPFRSSFCDLYFSLSQTFQTAISSKIIITPSRPILLISN